ncbi:cobalamin-binding protein [Chloroflexota bacterium]
MKKASSLLLLLLSSISVLIVPATGCINNEPETVTLTETYIKTVTTTSIITTTVEKVTIIDDLGREVTIEGTPSRIVSLAPSNTEILFALGLGDKVFGVTEYCNYPEEASAKEKVGGYSGVDMEKVVAINPDLILAEDLHKQEVIPALEQLGFTVIALVPHNLQEVMDSITLIGTITGAEAAASQIVDDISQRIKAITDVTDGLTEEDKVKVLYVIWHEPIMSVGTDTRIHELIEKAGGINIAEVAGEGYPTLALEEIVSINPQVIIVNDDISLQSILNETRLSEVDAIVNGMVYGINADLTNRPTARIIEGLELMAKMIHPELFGSIE